MSPEQQRIAIAEACGFERKIMRSYRETPGWYAETPSGTAFFENIPDYLNDLNACHEMEKVLRTNQFHYVHYWREVFNIVTGQVWGGDIGYFGFNLLNLTAAQRCEAFLKTIGKWTE